ARLQDGGRLINRARRVPFKFNGQYFKGFEGDTLASALLANGQTLMGRSFKYHRPRGVVASGAEEPNALLSLGQGGTFEPNARASVTPLVEGAQTRSQNHWPSLDWDVGEVNSALSKFFPAGFYYKTFMAPRAAWKHLFEPVIRQAAGLGPAPEAADDDAYAMLYAYCDVLVVGAGLAGLLAAREAADAGLRVILLEQNRYPGGRLMSDEIEVDGQAGHAWAAAEWARLAALPNVTARTGVMVSGVYDHGYMLAREQANGPIRERLWRIRATQTVTATGAIERPIAFAGNDKPGVMLASAVRDYVQLYGVSPGDRTVLVTNNDDAYRTAITLVQAGLDVPMILDARDQALGPLPQRAREMGVRVEVGMGVAEAHGHRALHSVSYCRADGEGAVLGTIPCECLAMSGGWSPVVHLWSHCGGKLNWDEERIMFRPDAARAPTGADGMAFLSAAGSANGMMFAEEVATDAVAAGQQAVVACGGTPKDLTAPSVTPDVISEEPPKPVWMMPLNAPKKLRSKAFLDFQNDVKVSDVELAAREGYESVEHTKRYTTLGMATDQGKLSNIPGLAILAQSLGEPIPKVGTTTFRPPYTPVTIGALAGEARGPLFKPLRKTAMDAWHDANGAQWEPVADWRRPYCYRKPGEDTHAAVNREVLAVRGSVGMLDASTLGKILVKGPDAAAFMDLLYTNKMSTLKPGRCRYGLMLNENGFLWDDGVVVRLDEHTFLAHTTTGNSDRVHAHMEEWLQTEWWDMKVYTANITEQFAQIVVAGPNARKVLESAGADFDLSGEALPFMACAEGTLAGCPARAYRISFSGELSYEIAVPRSMGQTLWGALREAGKAFDISPYGTEALHVLRAEKGFIMIGDETDGTVTPADLNLSWAISKKKDDFIGKRALERADLVRADRKQLVGLATEEPSVVLPDGAHAVEEGRMIGHVTSTYFSPTLGHSIAMALIERGLSRDGEVLEFPVSAEKTIKAKVVDPVFYDKEGARQNV
ncbi:MAG: sarcosine oxidase subunit alpha family protein, partial [Pseudomonadota bacterium]